MAKTWPFYSQNMVLTSWFFLNLSHCVQGCSMPNFTLLSVSCISLSKQWPRYGLLWPKLGPKMLLQTGSSWILINVPRDVPCQISHCWVYPVAPFSRNGQNMDLCGQNMVLKIGSFWILITMPRVVPCQISHHWVYPLAHFPRNYQKWPFYGQNLVFTWSFKLDLTES